jgi:ATP-dependent Clp protease ATP-binding subunit ClpC
MFERYTEKARRVIFFGRYEACQYGSPEIDTEHLLLGLLREDQALHHWLPKTDPETVRRRVADEHSPERPSSVFLREWRPEQVPSKSSPTESPRPAFV